MEGLIFMLVAFIISSFFSKGKQEKQQKPMPPFSNQKVPPKPAPARAEQPRTQSLEDFASEIFGQLHDKAKPDVVVQEVKQLEEPVPQMSAQRVSPQRPTRPALGASRPIIQQAKKQQSAFTVPRTQKEFVQAVMMAEVLGSPKAKQRK